MDVMTCYVCILIIALWLSCIAVACVVIDTVLTIKKYINEKKWIEQSQQTDIETDTSGGN